MSTPVEEETCHVEKGEESVTELQFDLSLLGWRGGQSIGEWNWGSLFFFLPQGRRGVSLG